MTQLINLPNLEIDSYNLFCGINKDSSRVVDSDVKKTAKKISSAALKGAGKGILSGAQLLGASYINTHVRNPLSSSLKPSCGIEYKFLLMFSFINVVCDVSSRRKFKISKVAPFLGSAIAIFAARANFDSEITPNTSAAILATGMLGGAVSSLGYRAIKFLFKN